MQNRPSPTQQKRLFAPAALLVSSLVLVGCQSSAGNGALLGTAAGAIAGQAIGGDTEGTLIGAGIGAGAGYIIGNEIDKNEEREQQNAAEEKHQRRSKGRYGY